MNKNKDVGNLVLVVLFLAVISLAVAGWVMNLLSLLANHGETLALTIARLIGLVVVPVGAILGWF